MIIFIGKNKESYGQITALLNREDSEKVILIRNKEIINFPNKRGYKIIEVDSTNELLTLKEEIRNKMKKEVENELEVLLSIASGNGKEHMALISALLSLPVGIKFVAYTQKGITIID